MSRFDELLNFDLPSKRSKSNIISDLYESTDYFDDFGMSDNDFEKDMETEGCDGNMCEDDDFDDDFENDISDFDDGDEETDPELSILDNDSDDDVDDRDDDQVEDLGPDEEQKVADTLDVVATPLLLAQEFSLDDLEEFTESLDCDVAIEEGYLTERTIVKFDKKAKLARAYEIALFKIARSHNDRDYNKLETVWRMERKLKARLRQKYHMAAMKQAREYVQRLRKSKSKTLSKLGRKIG